MESTIKVHMTDAECSACDFALRDPGACITVTLPMPNGAQFVAQLYASEVQYTGSRSPRTGLYELSIKATQLLPIRSTGKTTEQLQDAPKGAIFVWCNDNVMYAQDLRAHLKRNDITIMPLRWLDRCECAGNRVVIVDHAAKLSERQYQTIKEYRYQYMPFVGLSAPKTRCLHGSCVYGLIGRCFACNGLR